MKNQDLINLGNALGALNLKGAKFAYVVAKNLLLIKAETTALMKAQEPSKDFIEYDKERIALATEMSDKDPKGNPIIVDNNYKISDLVKFGKELDKLKAKHKKAFEGHEKQLKEFNELLQEKSKIKLHKIKLADVPADISTREMNTIMPLIEE